jgi:hypothetical protein
LLPLVILVKLRFIEGSSCTVDDRISSILPAHYSTFKVSHIGIPEVEECFGGCLRTVSAAAIKENSGGFVIWQLTAPFR